MYNAVTRIYITNVRRAFTAIGATLPKPVLKAMDDEGKLRTAERDLAGVGDSQIAAAIAECVLAGRDPAADETVRHVLMARQITQHASGLPSVAEARVTEAMAAHVDQMLAPLIAASTKAGVALVTAQDVAGGIEDPAILISKGGAAVEAWNAGREAEKLLRTLDTAWTSLAELTRFATASADPVLRIADIDLAGHEKVRHTPSPTKIVRHGGTITLADAEVYAARVQRLADGRTARTRQSEQDFKSAFNPSLRART